MASEILSSIDEIVFESDRAPRFTTEARPFSDDELAAFAAAGEHTGLE